jgi:hypothetical protein
VTWNHGRTDFRAVERIADPVFTVADRDAPVFTLVSYAVQDGVPGVERL